MLFDPFEDIRNKYIEDVQVNLFFQLMAKFGICKCITEVAVVEGTHF